MKPEPKHDPGAPRLALSAIAACLLVPAKAASAAILVGFAAALCFTWLARREIGGQTGDVLGATEVVTECIVLTVIAA